MAYDKNDPETKAALKAAVEAALEEAAADHEADVVGLKKKNRDLIQDLKDARAGKGGDVDTAEVDRVEAELGTAKKALKASEKALADAISERDEFKAAAETESGVTRKLLTENGLTSELGKVNVKSELLPAVVALLKGKVEIKEVNGERKAFVDGKPLGEFVKTWSESDEGKHYVAAPNNGGGAGPKLPGNPQGGDKKLSEMSLEERTALAKDDPVKLAGLIEADKAAIKKARYAS